MISSLNVILLFKFSPLINLILKLFSINNVASSVILYFCLFERLYKSLNLNACGVWVKIALFRFKLKSWFFTLYLIESLEFASGGNTQFFGELQEPTQSCGVLSDSHGGLGGF